MMPAVATDGGAAAAASATTLLESVDQRTRSMADLLEPLRPLAGLADRAAPLAAMVGDSFDDLMRTAIDSGIDVERGLLNGGAAALRFGAVMDAGKVRDIEALLRSGVLDPAVLHVVAGLGRALAETAASPPAALGPLGLLKALGNPEVQRALGFVVAFAERFGRGLAAKGAQP